MKKLILLLRDQWLSIINLFYPLYCAACGKRMFREFEVLCLTCETSLSKTNYHLIPDNPLELKFRGRCDIAGAAALYFFEKKGAVQKLLFHLKYKGNEAVGAHTGQLLGEQLQDSRFNQVDMVLPVPLHPLKEKIRGYNQVHSFARAIAQQLHTSYQPNLLIRLHNNHSQTKKNRTLRWENVQEIFHVLQPAQIKNKKILLVDDVVTTGATIEACCLALEKAGKCEVYVATLAVTL